MTKKKEYRLMIVSEYSDCVRNSFTMLRIKSLWLKLIRFETKDSVIVEYEDDRLIITKVESDTKTAMARSVNICGVDGIIQVQFDWR